MLKSILKYKTSTILTIFSLIVSFMGMLILTLYVSYEKSFDGFHRNEKQVYRLSTKMLGTSVPAIFSDVIQENTEVESITPIYFRSGKISIPSVNGTKSDIPVSLIYAKSSFFDLFTFPLQIGNPSTALTQAHSAVISVSLSKKLFGTANPMGEMILIYDEPFKISGVMTDFPENSSFQADCITSYATCLEDGRFGVKEWSEWSSNIFVKLRKGANPEQVAAKIEKMPVLAEKISGMKALFSNQFFFELTPLHQIHYIPESNYQSVNLLIIHVLMLLALILTLMGAVNFINFSTSQAPLRSKSLALLQVFGGKKRASRGQILLESVLLSLVAMVVVFGLHQWSYSTIESLVGIRGLSFSGRTLFYLWFLVFAIGFGILAGWYPARYITSSPIAQSVKGNSHFKGKGKTFRNVLITIQFVFAIVLMVSAFVIEKQIQFWQKYDMGIHKDNVVYLRTTPALQLHYQAFADELLKNQSIVGYTYSESIPGEVTNSWNRKVDGQQIKVCSWPVDDHFLDFFGIKMIEGRAFSVGSKADINTFILNKKAVEKFGWKNPLERKIDGVDFQGRVIGVTEDFNFSSLKEDIRPMLFWLTEGRKNNLLLRVKPENYTETRDYIKRTAGKFDGENSIDVQFLDDSLNLLYEKEENMGRFIELATIWCILLAVTGLLGLIIFICRDRIKEMGIRKVNGATVAEVVTLINTDIVKWVVLAFVIATPIAWYASYKWLENFAYKTALSWWIFVLAGLLVLVIALLTVSWQSWKAATRNPVEALKNE
jgi:putative ABC transport system permease protein